MCEYVWCPLSWGPKYSFDMVYVDFLVAALVILLLVRDPWSLDPTSNTSKTIDLADLLVQKIDVDFGKLQLKTSWILGFDESVADLNLRFSELDI